MIHSWWFGFTFPGVCISFRFLRAFAVDLLAAAVFSMPLLVFFSGFGSVSLVFAVCSERVRIFRKISCSRWIFHSNRDEQRRRTTRFHRTYRQLNMLFRLARCFSSTKTMLYRGHIQVRKDLRALQNMCMKFFAAYET